MHLKTEEDAVKFFIDTANLDEIKEAHSLGILDGVTTNPSLIAREGIVRSRRPSKDISRRSANWLRLR